MNRKVKKKGITPIVAIVILLLIAVAIAGSAYTWIGGYYTGLTGNAIQVTEATCDTTNGVTIRLTNIGTDPLPSDELTDATRDNFGTSAGTFAPATFAASLNPDPLNPGVGGTLTDATATESGTTFRYFLEIGGRTTQTQATC